MAVTPSLPTTITVGPFAYTVTNDKQSINQACREQQTDLLGRCEHRTLTIDLDPTQAQGQLLDTLLHECLHALTNLVGLAAEWDSDKEEAVVNRLSPALLALLRGNPDLVAYLVQ